MKARIGRRRLVWGSAAGVLGLLVFLIFFAAGSGAKELVISQAGTGKIFARWAAEDGMEFSIEFIHSVNQSPVKDIFTVDGRDIRPVATVFTSFGAGMQTELLEGQVLRRDDQGNLMITGFDQSFRQLNYIVGTVSDHILFINNESLSLRELCGKNAQIMISVR